MKKPVTNEAVGAKVRAARIAAGLTQEQLGEKIGRSPQSVAKYEKGTDSISVPMLVSIAAALKRKAIELIP